MDISFSVLNAYIFPRPYEGQATSIERPYFDAATYARLLLSIPLWSVFITDMHEEIPDSICQEQLSNFETWRYILAA